MGKHREHEFVRQDQHRLLSQKCAHSNPEGSSTHDMPGSLSLQLLCENMDMLLTPLEPECPWEEIVHHTNCVNPAVTRIVKKRPSEVSIML